MMALLEQTPVHFSFVVDQRMKVVPSQEQESSRRSRLPRPTKKAKKMKRKPRRHRLTTRPRPNMAQARRAPQKNRNREIDTKEEKAGCLLRLLKLTRHSKKKLFLKQCTASVLPHINPNNRHTLTSLSSSCSSHQRCALPPPHFQRPRHQHLHRLGGLPPHQRHHRVAPASVVVQDRSAHRSNHRHAHQLRGHH